MTLWQFMRRKSEVRIYNLREKNQHFKSLHLTIFHKITGKWNSKWPPISDTLAPEPLGFMLNQFVENMSFPNTVTLNEHRWSCIIDPSCRRQEEPSCAKPLWHVWIKMAGNTKSVRIQGKKPPLAEELSGGFMHKCSQFEPRLHFFFSVSFFING